MPYYPAMDGLRGLAALWVLLYHAWQRAGSPVVALNVVDLTPVFACGYFGVDLFFVLSGFLVGYPFVVARSRAYPMPALKPFWVRRIRRVMPAYLFQIAVLSVIALVANGALPLSPGQYVAHGLLVFNLDYSAPILNPVYWSLPVEWDFYLLLPLLALTFSPRGSGWARPLFIAVLFAVSFRALCWYFLERYGAEGLEVYRWIIQLPGRVDQFVFGMVAALLASREISARATTAAGIAGTILLAAMVIASAPLGDIFAHAVRPWLMWHFTLVGAAFGALIVYFAATRGIAARVMASAPLKWLGMVSYSLYLWHFPMLGALERFAFMPSSGSLTWWGLALTGSLLVAWLSYHFVERTFLAPGKNRQPG